MTHKSNTSEKHRARPFLKWVGGKGQLLKDMSPLFPLRFNSFYEPFVGGGAVFFHLIPEIAHLNDINGKLITTYKIIKSRPRVLIDTLKDIEVEYLAKSEVERKKYFLDKRSAFNRNDSSDLDTAALTIFLNKTCFNGMYRENSKGEFNVPFGKYVNPKICDEENINLCSKALKKVKLSSVGYAKAVESAEKGDFIYLDPPYDPLSSSSSFTSYSKTSFAKKEQIDLRDLFVSLDKRGCYVMLSNSATDFIKDIYQGYNFNIVKARRSINSKASERGEIDEIVVMNYKVKSYE